MSVRGAYRGFPTKAVDTERRARRLIRSSSTVAQTGISTVTDFTGLTVIFTVTADMLDGGNYACYVDAVPGWIFGATSTYNGWVGITDDLNVVKDSKLIMTATTGGYCPAPLMREVITTPGSYIRKVRAARATGTGTISHNIDLPESTAWIEARLVYVGP